MRMCKCTYLWSLRVHYVCECTFMWRKWMSVRSVYCYVDIGPRCLPFIVIIIFCITELGVPAFIVSAIVLFLIYYT